MIEDAFAEISSELKEHLKKKGFVPGRVNLTRDVIESLQYEINQYIAGLDPNKQEIFDIHLEAKGGDVYIYFNPQKIPISISIRCEE